MKDITYYSKEAIANRMSRRQAIGHKITEYNRYTEYGVVRICYKIDIKTGMAIVSGLTIIPGLFYIADNVLNDGKLCTNSETHYFDASSGQEISQTQAAENKNKNKQADLLNEEGNNLNKQGKYQKAYEKFDQAYQKCTNGYCKEHRFKSNRDIAKNNWADDLNKQGLELWNRKDFGEAVAKFQDAYNKCTNGYKNKQIFIDNMNHVTAENHNERGNSLYKEGKYEEAIAEYQTAYEKCPAKKSTSLNQYKTNKCKAQVELDAMKLKQQGDEEFKSGRYSNAQAKYQAAYEKSVTNKTTYIACANNADNCAKAEILNEQGMVLFRNGNYVEAIVKYKAAFDICSSRALQSLNRYKNNIKNAQIELEAIKLKEQGDKEFNSGRYHSAQLKYQEALNKSVIEKNTYITCINKTKAELLNEAGNILYNKGKYTEAIKKYQDAKDIFPSNNAESTSLNQYKTNKCKAQVELDAMKLKQQGDEEFKSGRYSNAQAKYQAAYENSEINKTTYIACVNNADNCAKAEILNEEGMVLFRKGNYVEAIVKYKAAFDICSSRPSPSLKRFKNNIKNAQIELEAIKLKEQGDKEFNSGRYHSAQLKYQEALNKSVIEKNTYITCINKTKAELLNEAGNILYNKGKYTEAIKKYQDAKDIFPSNNAESVSSYLFSRLLEFIYLARPQGIAKYSANIVKVQNELDAIELIKLGENDFNSGRYVAAKRKYERAYSKSSINANKTAYANYINKVELVPVKFKKLGDKELNAGRYESAKYNYQQAYNTSSVDANRNVYANCANRVTAEELNEEGDILYREGKFAEAIIKYKAASEISPTQAEPGSLLFSLFSYKKSFLDSSTVKDKYIVNIEKSKIELEALELKEQGDTEFNSGRYDMAKDKYQRAYNKSHIDANKSIFASLLSRTDIELEAIDLKELGDLEFNAGRFDNAKIKYQMAYDKSSIGVNQASFASYVNKATSELEARELKLLGDEEFISNRYDSAADIYQQAYERSTGHSCKSIYDACVKKAKGFSFWQQGWITEESGDSNEGTSQLLKANGYLKQAHQLVPEDQQFADWYHMSCLKLQGNELFNKGLESQQTGIELMKQASDHRKYELAEIAFKDAKETLSEARETFKKGCKIDERFVPCFEFTETQINQIEQSIKIIEQRLLSQGFLNIDANKREEHQDAESSDFPAMHKDCYKLI